MGGHSEDVNGEMPAPRPLAWVVGAAVPAALVVWEWSWISGQVVRVMATWWDWVMATSGIG